MDLGCAGGCLDSGRLVELRSSVFADGGSDDDLETAVAWNVVVPAQIRANLAAREIDRDDVLCALEVPLLVTQGMADTVVLPAMAEHVLATCPTAEASWYEGVGHVPHLEEPERFNRELAGLTRHRGGRNHVNGIDSTLLALGRRSVHDLRGDDVLIPQSFAPSIDADRDIVTTSAP